MLGTVRFVVVVSSKRPLHARAYTASRRNVVFTKTTNRCENITDPFSIFMFITFSSLSCMIHEYRYYAETYARNWSHRVSAIDVISARGGEDSWTDMDDSAQSFLYNLMYYTTPSSQTGHDRCTMSCRSNIIPPNKSTKNQCPRTVRHYNI